ncbi:MAG: DUF799 family lipoprotein [Syntrophales bacterium]|nr:DUF799 family lipoprotein [Syntrophales bacterium]
MIFNSIRFRYAVWTLALASVLTLSGCAKMIPHTLASEYDKMHVRLIAVLPVADKSGNSEVSSILRKRVVEALYFKGYPKIPTNVVDEKLALFFKNIKGTTSDALPPRDAGGILGVDAVLYITLKDCHTSFLFLYAPTSVEANFEMYNVKTGALMWRSGYRLSEKSFNITRERLRMESCKVFEPAVQQIVNKVMDTLPDAPEA